MVTKTGRSGVISRSDTILSKAVTIKASRRKVVEFNTTAASAYVKTGPRHWASGELLNECTMEQWVNLEGPILRVRFKLTYHGDTTHQPRHQETPAVFVSPRLATLVTYNGEKPWTTFEADSRHSTKNHETWAKERLEPSQILGNG